MKQTKIEGLIAAIVTPMDQKGNVNIAAIDSYANFLINRNVQGVFVNGTTGEGILMDNEERKLIAEEWMKYADKLKILVHVGSPSYKISQDLARHAQQIGAHAISAMGPCFLQPQRAEELVSFNKLIVEAAPDTPFYYYHIPTTSGVFVNMVDFLNKAKTEIPTLVGIKYTSYNPMEEEEILGLDNGRFDILHGHDECLLTGMMLGAKGGIGTSYNVTSPLYNKMMEAFNQGNLKKAVNIQDEAIRFIHLIIDDVNSIVGVKAMLNILGMDCGPCRLPIRNLTSEQMKKLEAKMKEYTWL